MTSAVALMVGVRIAINGIGVAGPALAYWLREYGHEPVLFEKAPALRTGGYVVDFWGTGYLIAEKMGIVPNLLELGYPMQEVRFVNQDGRNIASLDLEPVRRHLDGRLVSVARSDLAATLFGACEGIETHFGKSIAGLEQDDDGVKAGLSDGMNDRFDLVVGADGMHSRVRELVFGPQQKFERHLNCHIAAFTLRGYPKRDDLTYVSYTRRKRQAARFSLRDDATLVLMIWRSELMDGHPAHGEERNALRQVFGDMGWEVPDMLERMDSADDLYFDRISQIRMDRWSNGRVALIGDAAACVSPLAGEGSGLAMAEAYILAGELHKAGGDYAQAFRMYEQTLRKLLKRKQKSALQFRTFFAPNNQLTLKLRDWAIKLSAIDFLTKLVVRLFVKDNFELPQYPPSAPSPP